MPPARPRIIDDSRSETSSTVTNQKDKFLLGANSGSGVSKAKRLTANVNGHSGLSKVTGNGPVPVAPVAAESSEKDPSLHGQKVLIIQTISQTDWATMATPMLRTYRVAHRLPVPSAFNHPHAEITYMSSELARRAPSAVQARRKLRDQKNQRRKLQLSQTNGTGRNVRSKGKEKDKSKEGNSEKENIAGTATSIAQSIEPPDQGAEQDALPPPSPSTASAATYLGPREPASHLANTVRKHFNAQQLSEADTIARFIYVVRQSGRGVGTEGSHGDGSGHWMGSHGREVKKIDGPGGEVGFRLRFRP